MPSYSFYPNGPGGLPLASEEVVLANDADAVAYARNMLDWRQSATVVDIWEGERDVDTVRRAPAPGGA